ncbi:hypothetical protein DFH27DRAFT_528487 [Peziza echinospora]|nr:hypothetical protein DFH27DRAFT_528487 [Peziza echinospora]
MLHPVLSPIAPVSISFGERRSVHTTFSKPFPLGLGLMTGHSQPTHRPPYPSPPMSGSPDTFSSHRHKLEQSPRHNHQQDVHEHRRQPYPGTEHQQQNIASVAAGESRLSQPVHNPVPSQIGRPPFMPQAPSVLPLLPPSQRKTKTHVASACVNCKKAHLACDVVRPCPRCVGLSKQDSCIDVQHKKRGRPRLRDERTHSFEVNQMGSMSAHPNSASPLTSPTTVLPTYRPNTHRVIKAQSDTHSRMSRAFNSYGIRSPQATQLVRYFDDSPAPTSYAVSQSDLKAFLTTELVIAWSTETLRGFLGYQEHELNCVKSLFDIVSQDDRERLYRLSAKIQDEVREKDRAYLSPPRESVYQAIQSMPVTDVMKASTASRIYEETVYVKQPGGRKCRTNIRIQVVRASVFLVVADFMPIKEVQSNSQYHAIPPNPQGPPTQYAPRLSQPTLPSMLSPPVPPYATDVPPQQPYSLYPTRGLPSPVDSRPRSIHADATYPSLAQYANASTSGNHSHGRMPMSPNSTIQATFRRHSDQALISSSLKLPPLRSEGLMRTPESRHQPTSSGTERKRIAVEDVLQ